jgi:hypothetical protein
MPVANVVVLVAAVVACVAATVLVGQLTGWRAAGSNNPKGA